MELVTGTRRVVIVSGLPLGSAVIDKLKTLANNNKFIYKVTEDYESHEVTIKIYYEFPSLINWDVEDIIINWARACSELEYSINVTITNSVSKDYWTADTKVSK